MKRTNKIALVSASLTANGTANWRTVYEDNGRLYVKYNSKIIDITDNKNIYVTTK